MTLDDISSSFPVPGRSVRCSRRVEETPETKEACVMSDEGWNLRFCRLVDKEVVMAARVQRTWLDDVYLGLLANVIGPSPLLLVKALMYLGLLAQCNRPKPTPACTSRLGFSRLYILMLRFIVTQVIILHSYT